MILAVDLGATNIKAARFDDGLNKLSGTAVIPTCAENGREGIVRALKEAVRLMGGGADRLAVSSAGDVDPVRGRITYATENLPGMTGFDFKSFGREFFLPVSALNDAQAALLGEVYCGAGKGRGGQRIAMLTLGSGVGGAYFADGALACNQGNGYARYGHITLRKGGRVCTCGKRGCVETYLSGRAIHSAAARLGIDGGDIFERCAAGEERYVKFVNVIKGDLKAALKKVCAVTPFDFAIIGGGVADWFGPMFENIVNDTGYTVVKAALGNDAGMYGACVHAASVRGAL